MKHPNRPISNWIVDKILAYISDREGCEVSTTVNQTESVTAIFYDSFGFKYEMEIRCTGRVTSLPEGFDALSQGSTRAVTSNMQNIQKQNV